MAHKLHLYKNIYDKNRILWDGVHNSTHIICKFLSQEAYTTVYKCNFYFEGFYYNLQLFYTLLIFFFAGGHLESISCQVLESSFITQKYIADIVLRVGGSHHYPQSKFKVRYKILHD